MSLNVKARLSKRLTGLSMIDADAADKLCSTKHKLLYEINVNNSLLHQWQSTLKDQLNKMLSAIKLNPSRTN